MAARSAVLGAGALLLSFVACGGGDNSPGGASVETRVSSNPANVSIVLMDDFGNPTGSCAGTLIGRTTVLTAGHCVVAAARWQVTAPLANGGQTVAARRAATFDWLDFESSWSHPYHSDVALLYLNDPIDLPEYPKLVQGELSDGARAVRMHMDDATEGQFTEVSQPVHLGSNVGFPRYYYVDMVSMERLDTGGGLIDPDSNTLRGVVSGKGTTSGVLYVTRVDNLERWVQFRQMCAPQPPSTALHLCPGPFCHPDAGINPPDIDGGGSTDAGNPCDTPDGGPPQFDAGGNPPAGGPPNPPAGGPPNGPPGGDCDGQPCPPPPPPDGPGCTGPNCGGCGSDPNCGDNSVDYGDCGCTPPPSGPAPQQPTP